MMKKFLFLITVILLPGCSAPLIYIANSDSYKDKLEVLKSSFQNDGYEVKIIDNTIRDPHDDVLVIFNPSFSKNNELDEIRQLLKKNGFKNITFSDFNKYNHFYSDNRMEIFFPVKISNSLPQTMQTESCNGIYGILESDDINKFMKISFNFDDESEKIIEGHYTLSSDGVGRLKTLTNQPINFSLAHITKKTFSGEKNADIVTFSSLNDKAIPNQCSFIVIYE
ncbi:hypothetical protein [Shewanella sp. YIC-542]|uniref:hypothetical protein n=1 Tax=Shewanella mytili TaxID=3377111 RepID=UPI00398F77C8